MALAAATTDFWAVTCFYNPVGYRRRLENYHIFRRHLGVPLLTVELYFGNAPQLGVDDADVLVRIRGQDVIWQTERLFNVAFQALPPSCRKVAWIDCDMIFGRPDWADRAGRMLDQCHLVQLFSHVYQLPADAHSSERERALFSAHSVAYVRECEPEALEAENRVVRLGDRSGAPGGAWAGRREVMEKHALYDAAILGGGDRGATSAAYGIFDRFIDVCAMNSRQREHYLNWAKPFFQAVRGKVGCLEGDLYHLWHGEFAKRYYCQRHQGLRPFQFDPETDIAVASNGSWRWNSEKKALHDYVENYFKSRQEDG